MFEHKEHLFFDLDHTLWDYDSCSNETLTELHQQFDLSNMGLNIDVFLTKFQEINNGLWHQFHLGLIDKEVIRDERFPAILSALNIEDDHMALEIQAAYLDRCPKKNYLIKGAYEVLTSLATKYRLHIITNGFDEVQETKMNSGGIHHFFDKIITSGKVGYHKPDKRIFEFALSKAGTLASKSLMIGDNPISDIEGAQNAGIEQVFYNPAGLDCTIKPTLEIESLKELLKFF